MTINTVRAILISSQELLETLRFYCLFDPSELSLIMEARNQLPESAVKEAGFQNILPSVLLVLASFDAP